MSTDSSSDYSLGQSGKALSFMRFRNAERCCGFMKSFVRENSEILDCGCGPGSISVGLAQWASKGRVLGIDAAEEPLDQARALAESLEVRNLEFRRATIDHLPFEDESFDVVFSNAMICHIRHPESAIREMKRVLKPGGHIALRDVIFDSAVTYPQEEPLHDFFRLINAGIVQTGGNPNVGRELGELIHESGFADVLVTVGSNQPKTAAERIEFYNSAANLLNGDLRSLAIEKGWTTETKLQHTIERVRNLGQEAGALCVLIFGQAVGRKP